MEEAVVNLTNNINLNPDNNDLPNIEIPLERVTERKSIVDCDISSVTVYLDKAEICRKVSVDVKANQMFELLLYQLSSTIDKDSIRIEANGAPIIIQDVTFQTTALDPKSIVIENEKEEIEQTEKEAKREKESLLAKQLRLKKQRAVLEKFADILISQDNEKGIEINENDAEIKGLKSTFAEAFDPKHMETLNGFFIMYESQADKLDEQILNTKEELSNIERTLNNSEKRRLELEEVQEKLKSRELSIFIEVKETILLDLNLHYVVNQCTWKPSYDIRIINSESKMKITYYALISQNTLEDWKDIKQLVISTVQPPVGGTVPDIGIQKVFFKTNIDSKGNQLTLRRPTKLQKNQRMSKGMSFQERNEKTINIGNEKGIVAKLAAKENNPCQPDDNMPCSIKECNDDITSGSRSKTSTLERQETTSKEPTSNVINKFRLQKDQNKTDIPCAQYFVSRSPELIVSGGEPLKVVVGYIDLSPTFEYTSVPKRAPYAFLKATSTNSSEYVILPGEANIFIDSNFIGKTDLKTVSPGEEFTYNLGADHRIQIFYHPMYKYKEGSAPMTKTMCLTYKQIIVVNNNHSRSIKMILMDQLPIANEDKIKISLQEPNIKHPEKYDKSKPIRLTKNSQVEWDLEIGSGERKEMTLKYSIEYPAGECLDLINELN